MTELVNSQLLTKEHVADGLFRILTLDGGGAKGFYTLGVLKEIEAMVGCPLYKRFNLVFGTSTGAIITALIGLGLEVDQIHHLYKEHVPRIMANKSAATRTAALRTLAREIFKEKTFKDFKTDVGIVSTRWLTERPMIFKTSQSQAHGRKATFSPGFGVQIADAIQASCSAYPFFERTIITTASGDKIELIDGGYCANNPTLYAIADAVSAMEINKNNIRLVNVGVGIYPEPKYNFLVKMVKKWVAIQLLQKTFEINTQSMDQLREVIFKDVATIRISDTFERPEMATDLLEHRLDKLNLLRQRGADSFATREGQLRSFLC